MVGFFYMVLVFVFFLGKVEHEEKLGISQDYSHAGSVEYLGLGGVEQ